MSISQSNSITRRLLLLLTRLLPTLPELKPEPEQSETKLITRFLLPIFQALFDYQEGDERCSFDFINCNNVESHNDSTISKSRPDAIITSGSRSIGFVEAKPLREQIDTAKINKDLVRLGLFSKNAIDQHKLKCCLALQAVGTNIVFYLVEKANNNMYIMSELDQLYFPSSLEELPLIFGYMNNLYRLINLFEAKCLRNNICDEEPCNHPETLRSPILRAVVHKSTSRKRKSSVQYNFR